jgi:hypothetical protein
MILFLLILLSISIVCTGVQLNKVDFDAIKLIFDNLNGVSLSIVDFLDCQNVPKNSILECDHISGNITAM